MIRLTHVPRPPLSQFVHLLWLYEGYTQPHAKERVLPTGEMQIVINLLEDRILHLRPRRYRSLPDLQRFSCSQARIRNIR